MYSDNGAIILRLVSEVDADLTNVPNAGALHNFYARSVHPINSNKHHSIANCVFLSLMSAELPRTRPCSLEF